MAVSSAPQDPTAATRLMLELATCPVDASI
jgi:hypothetical protein